MNRNSLDGLADSWLMKKAEVEQAKAELIAIEQRILPMVSARQDGSVTTQTQDGKRVTVKLPTRYSLDGKRRNETREQIPTELLPLKVKELLDEPALKNMRTEHPHFYKIFSQCVSSKPGKPNVTIKEPAHAV